MRFKGPDGESIGTDKGTKKDKEIRKEQLRLINVVLNAQTLLNEYARAGTTPSLKELGVYDPSPGEELAGLGEFIQCDGVGALGEEGNIAPVSFNSPSDKVLGFDLEWGPLAPPAPTAAFSRKYAQLSPDELRAKWNSTFWDGHPQKKVQRAPHTNAPSPCTPYTPSTCGPCACTHACIRPHIQMYFKTTVAHV
mgnify:CR=1 FL=1